VESNDFVKYDVAGALNWRGKTCHFQTFPIILLKMQLQDSRTCTNGFSEFLAIMVHE
jgi:hypothetical protein